MICTEPCDCPDNTVCDSIIGTCSCLTGYFGPRCETCPEETFGEDCAEKCNCSVCETCNNITGTCTCYEQSSHPEISTRKKYNAVADDHSSHLVKVYIGMAAAILALVCIVAATARIKQKVCRLMRSSIRKAPKIKLQIRTNITTKSKVHTRNESVEACSNNLETHAQPFLCEIDNGYCEISEVTVSNHTRHNDVDQIDSTS